ncbi:MAG: alpha-L-fucosidase [Phycisphaerae bacterium]|nr:alpha-L-fucosidase [Phycisphaerae bacterium]
MTKQRLILRSVMLFWLSPGALAGTGDTSWMTEGKYGIFMHYQHRILLGYSHGAAVSDPKLKFPPVSAMTAEGWNRFVDGFDVEGFADQMAEGQVGWVLFCIDDHYFGWPCAPNKTFNKYAEYAPGQKCSRRDLIGELADALGARGVKLICYYAGLNGYMKDPKSLAGLMDDGNAATPPSAECRKRRIEVLTEYVNRYKDKAAGWWFDGVMPNSYREQPHDWWEIKSVVHSANPRNVIAFSWGRNRQACLCRGVDDFTSGDSYTKQDLTQMTPKNMPAQEGILWHGKIYCGNVYHGQGDANQYSDQELIDWINTCNSQGGVCTLDWPFDPKTGLIKELGMRQMIAIRNGVKGE